MTNEESTAAYESFLLSINPRKDLFDAHMAYMNACNWKDEQFKEYLENKQNEFLKHTREDFLGRHFDVCATLIGEIINELFKEQV